MTAMKTLLFILFSLFFSACGNSNSTDNKESTQPVIKVACVGDSITAGFGLTNPNIESYPAQLKEILAKQWEVKNFGHAYATLTKNSALPYWGTPEFTASHTYNPDIVIILLGTNDAQPFYGIDTSKFVTEYTELIQSYRDLPSSPTVYIAYPPPVYGVFRNIFLQNITQDIIPKIYAISSATGAPAIDLYTPLNNKPGLFTDGIHPNKEGAEVIANMVYQSIY